ncbi:MAG: transcriptional regulator, MerR family, partial [Clostridiales bacterium]|nr:transcriptional regulator, MerR family [Clostridiales bacterium]
NEVANIFDISAHTIRFYDKEGLLPFVARNKSGNREFTESDVNFFKIICCLKNTGMQIKDIKKYIDLCMEGTDTIDVRKKLLMEHRKEIIKRMNVLKGNLGLIDSKIEIYKSPNAVEIVNEQSKKASDEKRKNGLQ